MNKYGKNYGGYGESSPGFWTYFIGSLVILLVIVVFIFYGKKKANTYNYRKVNNKVDVKTLYEIPKGNNFHRVVDKELKVVCYLNAVGGGMECYKFEELDINTEEDIKKLTKKEKKVRRYNYNKYYYDKINNTEEE